MTTARPFTVVAINADPRVVRVIRADLGLPRVRRLRPLQEDQWPVRGVIPDLVLLGTSGADSVSQRRLIYRAWGAAIIIVEVHEHTPIVWVWRTPAVVQPVELAPGFLVPLLAPLGIRETRASPLLPALRCIGYTAVAANLLISVHSDHPGAVMLWLGVFLFLIEGLVRQSRRRRKQQRGGAFNSPPL